MLPPGRSTGGCRIMPSSMPPTTQALATTLTTWVRILAVLPPSLCLAPLSVVPLVRPSAVVLPLLSLVLGLQPRHLLRSTPLTTASPISMTSRRSRTSTTLALRSTSLASLARLLRLELVWPVLTSTSRSELWATYASSSCSTALPRRTSSLSLIDQTRLALSTWTPGPSLA